MSVPTVLIDGPPQVMLLAVDPDEDFVDVEGINIAAMLSLQATRINGTKLDTPKTDCVSGHSDATFSEKIFNVAVAEIEAIVEPGAY